MDYFFSVMGRSYQVEVPGKIKESRELTPFLFSEKPSETVLCGVITLKAVDKIRDPEEASVLPTENALEFREASKKQLTVYTRKHGMQGYLTKSILKENQIKILCDSAYLDDVLYGHVFVKKLYLESFYLMNRSFMLHSSLIRYRGTAVAFCAPKQTGKSTQASLWERKMGAIILNGDRAGIRLPDCKDPEPTVMAYGLPHSGSSAIYKNEGAPLRAIVLLEQAPVNTLEPVSEDKAFAAMFPQINVPRTDEMLLSLAMAHLEEVVQSVPVYLLKCTPDHRAVKLLYDELYGKGESEKS